MGDVLDLQFIDVYGHAGAYEILWRLLEEREPKVNISHQAMPTWDEHVKFVDSRPYKSWHLIQTGETLISGAVYLTMQNEIGIHVFAKHRGHGIGPAAVLELMAWHPGTRLFANIAPFNHSSLKMFSDLGFHLVEHMFKHRRSGDLIEVEPHDHARIEKLQLQGCSLVQHTFAVDTPIMKMGKTYADR